jgi:hypothetical protein
MALSDTVDGLIAGLLPWLSSTTLERVPRVEKRSASSRRTRSPSLSTYWQSNPLFHSLLQSNFPSFSSTLDDKPSIPVTKSNSEYAPGTYYISLTGLHVWVPSTKAWYCIHSFDSLDFLVGFVIPSKPLFFSLVVPS